MITHSLSEQCFYSYEDIKKWVVDSFERVGLSTWNPSIILLYYYGIYQKVVASDGQYFECQFVIIFSQTVFLPKNPLKLMHTPNISITYINKKLNLPKNLYFKYYLKSHFKKN